MVNISGLYDIVHNSDSNLTFRKILAKKIYKKNVFKNIYKTNKYPFIVKNNLYFIIIIIHTNLFNSITYIVINNIRINLVWFLHL